MYLESLYVINNLLIGYEYNHGDCFVGFTTERHDSTMTKRCELD